MYSTKNIEKILLAERLNDNTRSRYIYLENIEDIKKALTLPEFSQAVEAHKNGVGIYRGHPSMNDYFGAVVTPGTRISQNTSNIYTRLFSDILPSWHNFPKRNKSVICTNSKDTAESYGYESYFYIFPRNNTKIAIAEGTDIWYSFSYGKFKKYMPNISVNGLSEFNEEFIQYFQKYAGLYQVLLKNQQYGEISSDERDKILKITEQNIVPQIINIFANGAKQDILKLFTNCENQVLALYDNDKNMEKWVDSYSQNDISNLEMYFNYMIIIKDTRIIDILDDLFLPDTHEFILTDMSEYHYYDFANNEVWFEGEYLMIRNDIMEEIESDWV